jgi:hypothetical protein
MFLLVALLALTPAQDAKAAREEGTDFFYFDGERYREGIDVNFGLQGACRNKSVQMFAQQGVLLTSVRTDGRKIEPSVGKGYRHGAAATVMNNPGPSFYYHMSLAHLESWQPYDPAQPELFTSLAFDVRSPLPRRLEITYRIRCGDGSLSDPLTTRGLRFPAPRAIPGSE